MHDTSPAIAQKMREMIRLKTPTERVTMGCSMYETSKSLVIQAILKEDPSISKLALRKQLFLKFYGDDFDPTQRNKILKHMQALEDSSS